MATRAAEGPSTATIFRVVFTAAAAVLVLLGLYRARSVVVVVLVAAFLAVGLDPAVRRLEGWGLKRGHAVAAIFVAVLVALVGFLLAVVPPLASQVTNFATNLPQYVEDLAETNPRIKHFVEEQDIAARLESATNSAPTAIAGSIGGVLGVAGSLVASIMNVLLVIVLTIYFSLSLARIHAGTFRLVPKSKRKRVQELADPILEKIGGYIAGNLAISLIAGAVAFVFLVIAGVPYPIALALWVAIADLIPLVGATVGALPAVVVAFFTSTGVGIAAVIYFAIYQQVENYFIAPRVMTRAVDLPASAVLLAALVGGALMGFIGVLMAIPAAAGIKLIVNEVVIPKSETG